MTHINKGMPVKHSLSIVALALCLSAPALAKPVPIPVIKAPVISAETLKRVDQVLSSDAFEGRGPGTVGEEKTIPYLIEQFKAAVQAQEAILECHMVAGGFDYLLKTRMADMAAYRDFAGTVLWQLPGVRETRTYPVMEEVKNSTRLPL